VGRAFSALLSLSQCSNGAGGKTKTWRARRAYRFLDVISVLTINITHRQQLPPSPALRTLRLAAVFCSVRRIASNARDLLSTTAVPYIALLYPEAYLRATYAGARAAYSGAACTRHGVWRVAKQAGVLNVLASRRAAKSKAWRLSPRRPRARRLALAGKRALQYRSGVLDSPVRFAATMPATASIRACFICAHAAMPALSRATPSLHRENSGGTGSARSAPARIAASCALTTRGAPPAAPAARARASRARYLCRHACARARFHASRLCVTYGVKGSRLAWRPSRASSQRGNMA